MAEITNKKLNELAGIVKRTPTEKLRTALVKSNGIFIRVTENDKKSVKETASSLRLSVSEYIIKIHYLIKDQLK